MQNTGSFGAATGGMSPELQAAIQKRAGGNQGGTLNQVTASAPTFNPNTQPAPIPQGSAGGAPGISSGLPTGGDNESKIILKALKGRLESLSKIQEMGGNIQ